MNTHPNHQNHQDSQIQPQPSKLDGLFTHIADTVSIEDSCPPSEDVSETSSKSISKKKFDTFMQGQSLEERSEDCESEYLSDELSRDITDSQGK